MDWVSDPRFQDIDARMKNQDELDLTIDTRCREFTRDELMKRLIAADVLTAPLNSVKQVVDDPQNMLQCLNPEALGARLDVSVHSDETPAEFLARVMPPESFVFWPADRF